jgi:CRP-like cAMP-binding protein
VTLAFAASTVAELRTTHADFDRAVATMLADTVRRLSALVLEALYVPADTRVARRLADLAEVYADRTGAIEITLTQDDIASMAGTSRATVNRVLGELADVGAVEVRRGRIHVADVDKVVRAGR